MKQNFDVFSEDDLAVFSEECEKLAVPLPVILAYLKMLRKRSITSASRLIISDRRLIAAMDQAAKHPKWWCAHRIHFFCPKMTHEKIACLMGEKRESVTRYLNDSLISDDVWSGVPMED